MFIESIKINNFKRFNGEQEELYFNIPNGSPGSGMTILVGENNSGKSTVFEAFDFLRNSTKKDKSLIICKDNPHGRGSVEVTFSGNIEAIIDNFAQENKKEVFKSKLFEEEGRQKFRLEREIADKNPIKLWSSEDASFKNVSGIDSPLKKLFEMNFIWADTNPSDQTSFGSTTISGYLLKEIMSKFTLTDEYREFSEKFHETFNSEDSALKRDLLSIEERTQAIFQEQFGTATISFKFNEVRIDTIFKNISIEVDDGVDTPMEEKGTGMQRSIALALLQVYSEEISKHPDGEDIKKPFYLFIDEPEICLHPKAQEKLFKSLLELSKTHQIILTTHSPYFLISEHLKDIKLMIFSTNGERTIVNQISNDEEKLFPWSPSWGEINFLAYRLPTIEFHNELYGFLQEYSGENSINAFDNWLASKGFQKNKEWIPERNGNSRNRQNVTLQTFIRNKVHHPENSTMQSQNYSSDELSQSIEEMIRLCHLERS